MFSPPGRRENVDSIIFNSLPVAASLNAIIATIAGGAALAGAGVFIVWRQKKSGRKLESDYQRLRVDFTRANERAASQRGEKAHMLRIVTQEMVDPFERLAKEIEALPTDSTTPPSVTMRIEQLKAAVTQMRRGIAALQDLQKLEERSKALSVVEVNVGAILAEAVANAQAKAAAKNVRLLLPDPSRSCLAMADAPVLRKALENLINDAIAVTPPRGAVSFSVYQTADRVLMTVSDEGPGAPVSDRAQLLSESAHSAPPFATENGQEPRLNLAMVLNLITAMNGFLWSQSEPGRGTTHVIELSLPTKTEK